MDIFKEIKTQDRPPVYKYFIEGEWQESKSGKLIPVVSPVDHSLIGKIQAVTLKEADLAITGASVAQSEWANVEVGKRITILTKVGELLIKHKNVFSELLTLEIGKTKKDAEHELKSAYEIITGILKNQSWSEEKKIRTKHGIAKLSRMPRGVVLCIAPFNYPISTALMEIVPALFTGNAVVLKPSVLSSIVTLHLVQLFKHAGLPFGVLNIVTGSGERIGRYLSSHRLINAIVFTGSTKAGREIAKRAEITKLVLELGGKDPAIVLKDADLNLAASEITEGAFVFAGQRCVAIKRVIVEKQVKDELIKKIKEKIKENFSIIGDPRDERTQLGPVITPQQADYLQRLIKDAVKKGAKIVCGGQRYDICPQKERLQKERLKEKILRICRMKARGNYFQATVLDNVKLNMKIAWEEQFGPVLPIITAKNEKEAINIANASQYGLDAAIFTRDIKKAEKLAEKLEVGQVFINTRPMGLRELPFTGIKDSGLGSQGLKESIEEITVPKVIIGNRVTRK